MSKRENIEDELVFSVQKKIVLLICFFDLFRGSSIVGLLTLLPQRCSTKQSICYFKLIYVESNLIVPMLSSDFLDSGLSTVLLTLAYLLSFYFNSQFVVWWTVGFHDDHHCYRLALLCNIVDVGKGIFILLPSLPFTFSSCNLLKVGTVNVFH